MKIGELAQATRTSPPTIRYYESIGLLPSPSRVAGQRRYGDADVRRLTFVRRCRELGFSLDQVRRLTALTQDSNRSCLEARDVAQAHLTAVQEKLRELHALEAGIEALIAAADATCRGGSGADCVVLSDLSTAVR